ncbi:ShlB/FhaC/HecB family hemolysin secretion/activation protein, partial [Campylobacter jejuni]
MLEQSPYKEDANSKNYNNTLKVKDGVIIIDHSNTSDNNNSKTINTKKNTQKNQPNLSNDNTLKTKTPNSNTPSLKNTSKEESIH